MAATWIFQGNPNQFDVDSYIEENDSIFWSIRQEHFFDQLKPNDIVYIWRSRSVHNQEPSIVAKALIQEVIPNLTFPSSETRYFRGDYRAVSGKAAKLAVIEKCLPDGLTKSHMIEFDRTLEELPIIRMAQRTNYIIDDQNLSLKLEAAWQQAIREDAEHIGDPTARVYTNTNSTRDREATTLEESCWILALGKDREDFERCCNESVVSLGWSALGDLRTFNTKAEVEVAITDEYPENDWNSSRPTNSAYSVWSFAHGLQIGDCVYIRDGRTTILGKATIVGPYEYRPDRDKYPHVRKVVWSKIEEHQLPEEYRTGIATLTGGGRRSSKAIYGVIESLFENSSRASVAVRAPKKERAAVTAQDAHADLFFPLEEFNQWLEILRRKKNVILQGPPGVGKTLVARKLSKAILGHDDPSLVFLTQFHEAYSYEDFVEGIRLGDGQNWTLQSGVLLRAIESAKKEPCVLLIDEINRGNISRILGEALMLIEPDKRGKHEFGVRRAYAPNSEVLVIPENLYIIGTMNTADRSLAVVDYALRRRFAFIDLHSMTDSEKFREHLQRSGISDDMTHNLKHSLSKVNRLIRETKGMEHGFEIGHSYFCSRPQDVSQEKWLTNVLTFEILPLLREYWIDDIDKIRQAKEAFGLS